MMEPSIVKIIICFFLFFFLFFYFLLFFFFLDRRVENQTKATGMMSKLRYVELASDLSRVPCLCLVSCKL